MEETEADAPSRFACLVACAQTRNATWRRMTTSRMNTLSLPFPTFSRIQGLERVWDIGHEVITISLEAVQRRGNKRGRL